MNWPAPGAEELAGEVESLLAAKSIAIEFDAQRGFDHGTFVPMALTYPHADIPTRQLSLKSGLDPHFHYQLGRALAPLRDQGIVLVGSGMSYHNLRNLIQHMRGGPAPSESSLAFVHWLVNSMQQTADVREKELLTWEHAPFARECHPREEHLLPLHVMAGAGEGATASFPFRDKLLGAHVSAVHFS